MNILFGGFYVFSKGGVLRYVTRKGGILGFPKGGNWTGANQVRICYDRRHEGVDEPMALSIRLETDRDFEEAARLRASIRVFKDDHMVDSGGIVLRFDDSTVVVQSSVSEIAYHARRDCEFFMVRQR